MNDFVIVSSHVIKKTSRKRGRGLSDLASRPNLSLAGLDVAPNSK